MYDWIEFDPKKPPQVEKTYLVYVPGNETGEYITTEFYNYDGETCFWCVLTGSEVQGVTHYSEINTNVSSTNNTAIRQYGIALMAAKNLCKEIDHTGAPKDTFAFRAIAKNLKVLLSLIDWKAIDSLTLREEEQS